MTSQTEHARSEKSKGRAPKQLSAPETAAETHAVLRARSGFDINQLAAEYRALRASVLRLWLATCLPQAPHIDDIIRFNEAIDQALIESIAFFSAQVDQSRNLLLGMIGHDLRSPLQAIQMTAAQLSRLNAGQTVSDAASRVVRSGARMKALLDDLVEFNRTQLGLGIHITPTSADLATLFTDELEQLRAAHPNRQLHLETAGDTQGMWDGSRLQQVLGNLVLNAIKYGAADTPVRVVISGEDSDVRFEVRNTGPVIAQSILDRIFDRSCAPRNMSTEAPTTAASVSACISRTKSSAPIVARSKHGQKIRKRCSPCAYSAIANVHKVHRVVPSA